jgi:hypothetical protein
MSTGAIGASALMFFFLVWRAIAPAFLFAANGD